MSVRRTAQFAATETRRPAKSLADVLRDTELQDVDDLVLETLRTSVVYRGSFAAIDHSAARSLHELVFGSFGLPTLNFLHLRLQAAVLIARCECLVLGIEHSLPQLHDFFLQVDRDTAW
jgi:hypothetical protein